MKVNVKTAIKGRQQFDLSSKHYTTMDFGMLQPTFFAELVPNDVLNVNIRFACRLASLQVPTFGNIKTLNRVFFVPMRSLWQGFKDWYDNSKDSSLASSIPTFTNTQLVMLFTQRERGLVEIMSSNNTPYLNSYDIVAVGSDGKSNFYRFTEKGRLLYKVLLSLGYSINFTSSSSSLADSVDETQMSALPLLALIRVLYDYVYPSDYVQGLGVGSIFTDRSSITFERIFKAFEDLSVLPFRDDYFTSAWLHYNQHGPSDNLPSTAGIVPNSALGHNIVSSTANNNVINLNTGTSLTDNALRLLSSVSNFMRRNNIVGTRYFEQMLARFGVRGYMVDPDRSQYLNTFSDDIQIMDVTSSAATDLAELGEQAAKGFSFTQNAHQFQVQSNDSFGYVIVLSSISPDYGYFQGRKRHTLHTSRFSFYTPEFDNVGLQSIRNDELFADYKNQNDYAKGNGVGGSPNLTFGYAPRYVEYKKGDDYLTGDFRVPSLSKGLDSYHLLRVLDKPSPSTPLSLGSQFRLQRQFEFDRIFQVPSIVNPLFRMVEPSTHSWPLVHFQLLADYRGRVLRFNLHTAEYAILAFLNNEPTLITFAEPSIPTIEEFLGLNSSDIVDASFNTSLYSINILRYNSFTDFHVIFNYLGREFAFNTALVNRDRSLDSSSHVLTFSSYYYQYNVDDVSTSVANLYNYEDFLRYYQECFDHFYCFYNYDVRASRTMLSISESIAPDDGGAPISVDYGGHNFSS